MPLKKRAAAIEFTEHHGRHPMLKLGSDHFAVWTYVKGNPGCTRTEAWRGCDAHPQVVADLLNQGIIRLNGLRRNSSACIEAVPGGETGAPRQRVEVKLAIQVDSRGYYHVQAEIVGGQAHNDGSFVRMVTVMEKVVSVDVPKVREFVNGPEVHPRAARANVSGVLDTDYQILED